MQTEWDLASEVQHRCWEVVRPAEEAVNRRLIELADIHPGDTVLDVATGIGEPALTVAAHVAPSGRVIAIDQSPGMLAVAARRARDAGLSNIEFRLVDANALELPEASVGAVVCRWGLMFITDLIDGLARMRRCLASGRRLAAVVWSDRERVPYINVRRRVMRDFDIPPPAYDPFSLSSESALHAAASAAGFGEIRVEKTNVAYEFRSAQTYADFQRDAHESRLRGLQERSPEQQADFWTAVAREAGRYADSTGTIHMPSEILLLSARK